MTGHELRAACEALGLTQARLAAILDVAPEHVSRMQTGAKPITTQTALVVRAMLAFGLPDGWPHLTHTQ